MKELLIALTIASSPISTEGTGGVVDKPMAVQPEVAGDVYCRTYDGALLSAWNLANVGGRNAPLASGCYYSQRTRDRISRILPPGTPRRMLGQLRFTRVLELWEIKERTGAYFHLYWIREREI